MKLHQSIMLADGRVLSYADIGDPAHHPVLYFHGFPGSRLEAAFAEQTILACRVRVIAVERPGYGQSTHYPARQILDWPDDVSQLADALGLARFSVLGMSTGGVYALACAYAMGDRIHSTGIAGTLAPVHNTDVLQDMNWISRYAFRLMERDARRAKWIVGRLLGHLIKHYPEQIVKGIKYNLCLNDRLALMDKKFHGEFIKSICEAYQHGYAGPFHDLSLATRAWGFAVEDIQAPIHLWHGLQDSVVPHSMGQYLAERLANCQYYFPEQEGHFSIITNYMQHALLTLKNEQSHSAGSKQVDAGKTAQQTHTNKTGIGLTA